VIGEWWEISAENLPIGIHHPITDHQRHSLDEGLDWATMTPPMERAALCSLPFGPHRPVAKFASLLFAPIFIFCSFAQAQDQSGKAPEDDEWAATWGCAPAFPIGQELANQTLRQFVRISVGGKRVRIRLSNETGTQPLVIGAAHLALAGPEKGSIDPSSDHVLTFNGSPTITVPPGAPMLSDPLDFEVRPLTTLAVSLYITRDTGGSVIHPLGGETAYLSQSGDQSGATTIADATTVTERYFLTRIEVNSPNNAGTIVALGDSITDGRGSTVDANRRWPDRLAERLHEQGQELGVVNAGIAGNRILHDLPELICGPSSLSRFDRDVLSVPTIKFVIVLQGVTDIGHPVANALPEQAVSSEQVIGGLKQLIARARARHLKIFGATLLPEEGDVLHNEEGEAKRKAVNEWIRTSKAFDGVIDFEAAVRDPDHPARLRAEYDSGDHGHLNDAGYRAMADSIDLKLFAKP
jgi:lysophospholipase L1-like esterase